MGHLRVVRVNGDNSAGGVRHHADVRTLHREGEGAGTWGAITLALALALLGLGLLLGLPLLVEDAVDGRLRPLRPLLLRNPLPPRRFFSLPVCPPFRRSRVQVSFTLPAPRTPGPSAHLPPPPPLALTDTQRTPALLSGATLTMRTNEM